MIKVILDLLNISKYEKAVIIRLSKRLSKQLQLLFIWKPDLSFVITGLSYSGKDQGYILKEN